MMEAIQEHPEKPKLCRSRMVAVWDRCWAFLGLTIITSSLVSIFWLQFARDPIEVASDEDISAQSTILPLSDERNNDRRRFILFRSFLARASEPSTFVNPNSPQSQALKWLVYQDQTIQFPDSSPKTDAVGGIVINNSISQAYNMYYGSDMSDDSFRWKLVQRYALMVLAFSTNGASWRGIEPWENMIDVDECDNQFEGVRCDEVSGKVTIVKLDFQKLGGRIPPEIGLLTELKSLDLSRNLLEGHIPHAIYNRLSNLEHLILSHNEIAFSLSNDIGKLTSLQSLVLSNAFLSGRVPDAMVNLTSIRQMVLPNNRLSGSIMHNLPNWPDLEVLILEGNPGITGVIPSEIGMSRNLREISLGGTNLKGAIPSEIGLAPLLKKMVVGGDFITGTLPSEIGSLSHLSHIVLSFAPLLEGPLPTTIGQLSALKLFAVFSTSMGGSIPSEIGLLTSLVHLNLENNLFAGEIPSDALKEMVSLNNLQINANFFSGTIPQEICDNPSMVLWMDCTDKLVCENDCCIDAWCSHGDV